MGEVRTHSLEGELGVISKQVKNGQLVISVGLDLKPLGSDAYVAAFECGSEGVKSVVLVGGSVIAPIAFIDTMTVTSTLRYLEYHGKQRVARFEGGAPDVLLTSLAGGVAERSGLKTTSTITSEEPLEIRAML